MQRNTRTERARELRDRGLTLRAIGQQLGVSAATISRDLNTTLAGKPARPKPKNNPVSDLTGELGRSGTVNTRGFLRDNDTNPQLQWPRNLDEYDLMCRSDPSVRWMLALLTTPIRAAEWTVEPAGKDPEDVEMAAAVEHALFHELEGGWDETLRQALDMVKWGHMLFELVAEQRKVRYEFEPPRPEGHDPTVPVDPVMAARDMFIVARLAPRLPRTIMRWNTVTGSPSELESVEQRLFGGETGQDGMLTNPVIPAGKLVVLTHEREGDDFRGVSVLRTAWRAWRYKVELENLEAIACERSTGVPVAYPPVGAGDAEMDAMEDALTGLRQGENVYLLMPPGGKAGPQNPKGWLVEMLNVEGDGGAGLIDKAIQRHEAALARNVLAEFMRLGHAGTGARATGDVQQSPYYQAVDALIGYVCDVFTERVVKPLCRWNWPDPQRFPRLAAGKVREEDILQVAQAFSAVLNAGAVKPDPDVERWLRRMFGAPDPIAGWEPPSLPQPQGEAGSGGPPEEKEAPEDESPAGGTLSPGRTDSTAMADRQGAAGPCPCGTDPAHAGKDCPCVPFDPAAHRDQGVCCGCGATFDTQARKWGPGHRRTRTRRRDVASTGVRGSEQLNWVSDTGGLPEYIHRVARHVQEDGHTESEAIAIAVSQAKKNCARGHADACAAVAEWERKRAEAHATSEPHGAADMRLAEWRPARALTHPEQHVALADIHRALNNAQDDFAQAAVEAAQQPIRAAMEQAGSAVNINSPEVIQAIKVDPAPITTAVHDQLRHVYERGRVEVRAEIRRQQAAATLAAPETPPRPDPAKRLAVLAAKAAAAAEAIAAAATRAIRQWALRRLDTPGSEPTGPGFDPEAAARGEAKGAARGMVAGAFSDGRTDEMVARSRELRSSVYSSVMDTNSCGPCDEADGTEGPPGGLLRLPTPNPECEGGGACRCLWLPVVREVSDAVPAEMLPVAASDWQESEHPRRKDGEFARKGAPRATRIGLHPASEEERKALAIPPAWTDVHVTDDPKSDVVAHGLDSKGRRQTRYSSRWDRRKAAIKFGRVEKLDDAFDGLRDRMRKDAETDDAAAVLLLIAATGLRVGSTRDTKAEKQAVGASTLRREHVHMESGRTYLRFVGKDGVDQNLPLESSDAVRLLHGRLGRDGDLFDATDRQVREYWAQLDGRFKVKDLRTHVANRVAVREIEAMPAPTTRREFKQARRRVAERVAERLGNTPAMALNSYINPTVFAAWEAGLEDGDPVESKGGNGS